MNVQDLIDSVLQDIAGVAQGETPTAAERAQGLFKLNLILSMLSTDRAMVYQAGHSTFVLQANLNAYTLGPSGSWVTTVRPVKVEGATSISGFFRQGMDVLSFADFAQIDDGIGSTATLPSKMGVDNASPNLNVRVWPTPNSFATVEAHYWTPFAAFTGLTDPLDGFPPGYNNLFHKLLVIELAPSYGREAGQTIQAAIKLARESLGELNLSIVGRTPQAEQQQQPK